MYKENLKKCVDVMSAYNHHISRDTIIRTMVHDGIIHKDDMKFNQQADEMMMGEFGYSGFINNINALNHIGGDTSNVDAINTAPAFYYAKYAQGVLRDSTLRDAALYGAGENGYWMWMHDYDRAFSTVQKSMLMPLDFSDALCANTTFNLNRPDDLKVLIFNIYRHKFYYLIRYHKDKEDVVNTFYAYAINVDDKTMQAAAKINFLARAMAGTMGSPITIKDTDEDMKRIVKNQGQEWLDACVKIKLDFLTKYKEISARLYGHSPRYDSDLLWATPFGTVRDYRFKCASEVDWEDPSLEDKNPIDLEWLNQVGAENTTGDQNV